MATFTGSFENKVDSKGRVSLPADYRSELPAGEGQFIYIFPSPKDDILEACDQAFMERIVAALDERPMFSDEEDSSSADIVSEARKTHIDGTGRMVLPQEFIEFAGITKKATFVGKGSRFQIWSPERRAAYKTAKRARGRIDPLQLPPAKGA